MSEDATKTTGLSSSIIKVVSNAKVKFKELKEKVEERVDDIELKATEKKNKLPSLSEECLCSIILFLLTAALGAGMVASLLIGCGIIPIPLFLLSGGWKVLAVVCGFEFLIASSLGFKMIYDDRKNKSKGFKFWQAIFAAVSIISGYFTTAGLLAGFEICPASVMFLGWVTMPALSPFYCFFFAGCFGGVCLTYSICSIISVWPEKEEEKEEEKAQMKPPNLWMRKQIIVD